MKKVIYSGVVVCLVLALWYALSADFRQAVYYQYYTRIKHPEIAGGPCGPNCDGYIDQQPTGNSDTLPLFANQEVDRMLLTGTIYDYHGNPAEGVLLYVFHTDSNGIYLKSQDAKGAEALNGYIRGWILTEKDGRYYFYTNKPGAYPDGIHNAHIHCIVKEPEVNVYALPDFVFKDDPLLSKKELNRTQQENGGVVRDSTIADFPYLVYVRDIYLGKKVVNYPKKKKR
ncbi:MAG TPA: hypothetical protein PKY29_07200 [Ferruginibacter sp.]|nr:hypothetical protein [Ferruginibacter sp.]HRO17381.1 hypothetical protein [Ferruginibacter sp.]HRQ21084.1 hypothetical protein [Ferruginibacter sp.]